MSPAAASRTSTSTGLRRGARASMTAAQMTTARYGMSMYARAARNGKSKRVTSSAAATAPTSGVKAVLPSA